MPTALHISHTTRDVSAGSLDDKGITYTLVATEVRTRCTPTWRRLMVHPYVLTISSPKINPAIREWRRLQYVILLHKLAAHVVDVKGASAEHAVKQVLRDLRKWAITVDSE